jgi:hypothetical protein
VKITRSLGYAIRIQLTLGKHVRIGHRPALGLLNALSPQCLSAACRTQVHAAARSGLLLGANKSPRRTS